METETDKIFKKQLRKLSTEIVDFISSTDWDTDLDKIGYLYNLSGKNLNAFKREVTLVLTGLVHPDEFKDTLRQEAGIEDSIIDALVADVESKIFAPIRPALIEFFEKEAEKHTEETTMASETNEKPRMQIPDVAPENLPTDEEGESLLSLSQPKTGEGSPTHPFEEKMKRVFTAGQQSLGEFAIEPSSQAPSSTQTLKKAPPIYSADPYREAIE